MSPIEATRCCVQALAQPAQAQLGLFPSFVLAGEEMALEFDDALRAFQEAAMPATEDQATCLTDLDRYLDQLSTPANEEFWLEPSSLCSDPRWEKVRELARAVLLAFGWPNETPRRNGVTYVSGDTVVRNE